MVTWVKAQDIENWASRVTARYLLPELVRKLIYATIQNPQANSFPSSESVQSGGWDGWVETSTGSTFVPDGISGWELSTEKDVKGKLESDFEKRTGDPLEIDSSSSTFVFVTPRRWSGKRSWTKKTAGLRKWKSVKVIDADDLEQWIETAPAVGAWFARQIGIFPDNVEALSDFWQRWSGTTKPALPSSLLLSRRSSEIRRVQDWLRRPPSVLPISADTDDEAIAFVAAVLESGDEATRTAAYSRALLVNDEISWRYLSALREPMTLIPRFSVSSAGLLSSTSHRVLRVLVPRDAAAQTVRLSTVQWEDISKSLQDSGIDEERADRLGRHSGKRLSVLRRMLEPVPDAPMPDWALPAYASSVAVFALIGGWDDSKEGDREFVEAVSGQPYELLQRTAVRWVNTSDPLLRNYGERWELISRLDAWSLLDAAITKPQMARFLQAAVNVLGELNPRYELPPEERIAASLRGKVLRYSEFLREHIASTLALMSACGRARLPAYGASLPDQLANASVRRLLENNASPHFWASISDVLPTLAEAAPDVVLHFIEEAARLEPSPILEMFVEEGFMGSSPYTGLLWALERVAWEPRYLTRVSLILATLARIDPGGHMSNRPLNSLNGIFLFWYPQTRATFEQRLASLDEVVRREPEVAWKLLIELLPERHSIAIPTVRPNWREWASGWTPGVLRSEYGRGIEYIAEKVLQLVGQDGLRWKQLLEHLDDLPPSQLTQTVDRLRAVSPLLEGEDRLQIWNCLRGLLNRHNQYGKQGGWGLPDAVLDNLGQTYEQLVPQRPQRFAWLFSSNPTPPYVSSPDWRAEQAIIDQEQSQAACELLKLSIDNILAFAEGVERPDWLGRVIGRDEGAASVELEMMREAFRNGTDALVAFGAGFVAGRAQREGDSWKSKYLPHGELTDWETAAKASFLLGLPQTSETWDLVAACGEQTSNSYWQRVFVHYSPDPKDAEIAARKLSEVGRPYAALDTLSLHVRNGMTEVAPELLYQVLEDASKKSAGEEQWVHLGSLEYHIGEALLALANSEKITKQNLLRLEWHFLPLLRHTHSPKTLHAALATDPQFFIDVVSILYRAENEPKVEREFSEQETARIHNCHELLHTWSRIPGFSENGALDQAQLFAWVEEAQRLAREAKRLSIAEQCIGNILAHAPRDEDGVWPHKAVRELIETVRSEHVEQGIHIGVCNNRGMTSRAIGEGGEQERELSASYHRQGDQLVNKWPRTAGVLYGLADAFDHQAYWHDLRAEED